MKKGFFRIVMVGTILLSSSLLLTAQYGRGMGGFYGQSAYVTPALTEKQKTDMTALRDKYRVESDTLRAQLRRSTDIKKRGELAGKIQILSDTHKKDLENILTTEQKQSIETAKNEAQNYRMRRDSLMNGYGRLDSIRRELDKNMPFGMGSMRNSFMGRSMMPGMMNSRNSSFSRDFSSGSRGGNMQRRR